MTSAGILISYINVKENCFLLSVKKGVGAGGLSQSKKSLSENTQNFFTKGFNQVFGKFAKKNGVLYKKKLVVKKSL